MSKVFKTFWRKNFTKTPYLDLQTLDLMISDVTAQMAYARNYSDWNELYHRREALQIERNLVAQNV